jgi:hypothetical protein
VRAAPGSKRRGSRSACDFCVGSSLSEVLSRFSVFLRLSQERKTETGSGGLGAYEKAAWPRLDE